MDLVGYKCVLLALLMCARVGVGLSPLFLCRNYHTDRKPWVDVAVALCLSLAGGVLLATSFLHLVPQVRAALHHFLPKHTFPITELLIVAGYFLTFFLDEAFISFRSETKVYPIDQAGSPSSSNSSQSLSVQSPRPHNILRAVLLSLHTFAKGAAVGLADTLGDLWFLFVATAVHEFVAVVSFTLHLMRFQEPVWLIALFSVLLAFVMVLGVIVGIVLTSTAIDAIVVAVVRGLAAGNILYVTFYELLTRETRVRALGLPSILLALIGFLFMLVLQFLGTQETKYTEQSPTRIKTPSEESDYDNSYAGDNQ